MRNKTASDYSDFITVQDILHPEIRQVTAPPQEYDDTYATPTIVVEIDGPDVRHNINSNNARQYRNRWDAVWTEATVVKDTFSKTTNDIDSTSAVQNTNIAPVVQQATNGTTADMGKPEMAAPPPPTPTPTTVNIGVTKMPPYCHGNLLEVIFGMMFVIMAITLTFAFEIGSMVVYVVATVLHTIAGICHQNHSIILGLVFQICAFVFFVTAQALMLVDFSLFIVAILCTEVFAISAGIVNSILSCFASGVIWHQYIRKICHLSRWAFRDMYPSTAPSRIFPLYQLRAKPTIEEQPVAAATDTTALNLADNTATVNLVDNTTTVHPADNTATVNPTDNTTSLNPEISAPNDPTIFVKE